MGLDTSHDCWHGPYSSFNRWRMAICKAAGLGSLNDRIGFGGSIPWTERDGLIPLLDHEDCEGEIRWQDCSAMADRLTSLLPLLRNENDTDGIEAKTLLWIKGLRLAAHRHENVVFE
jgi:hypothetical protein